MTTKRDISIDTMRGVACLLLVGMHVIGHEGSAGIKVPDDSAYRWFAESFRYVRMPLFSFLAGFVYAWRPLYDSRVYGTFMRKKVKRLLVPYAVFIPIIGTAQAVVPAANTENAAPWFAWWVFPLSPYWFLIATFWIFSVVALLDGQRLLDRRRVVILSVIVLGVLDVLLPAQERSEELLGLRSSLFLATFFMAGLAASRFDWRSASRRWQVGACVTFGLLFAYVQLGLFGVAVPMTIGRHHPVGLLLGLSACLALVALRPRSAWVAWVGGYSSGIYLLHPFTVASSRVALGAVGVTALPALAVTGLVVGVLGAVFGVRVLRRLPGGAVVLGESRRGSSTPAARAASTRSSTTQPADDGATSDPSSSAPGADSADSASTSPK